MRCAGMFRCDVCEEKLRPDPRPPSTLEEIVPKWHTVQCDGGGTWTNHHNGEKRQFLLGIDEGCRLMVGKLLFQHQTRTPSAQGFIDFYEGRWMPNFGNPEVVRLDPADSFRSKHLDVYLAERNIFLQHIPAEAHWQISLAEPAIQTTKAMMNALVSECPEMTASEAFARSLWAANTHDQYRGYSPLQHAYGRSPDHLGHLGDKGSRRSLGWMFGLCWLRKRLFWRNRPGNGCVGLRLQGVVACSSFVRGIWCRGKEGWARGFKSGKFV